jgi:hypothetical protein
MTPQQTAAAVLMVRPAGFGYNADTASSNTMQHAPQPFDGVIGAQALQEFAALVGALRSEGIATCVVDDEPQPQRPDALFPNNWVSFHADGSVVLYPMLALNRRLERREAVIAAVRAQQGFRETRRIDLTAHEAEGRYLEGTGSLVLDHAQRIAYACRSPRTDESLVREWARTLGFEPVVFDATDAQGLPYYHTNVMLWIGNRVAGVCLESIAPADRARVRDHLRQGERELCEFSRTAVGNFAGNMLELASWDENLGDCSVLVMSATARAALSDTQWRQLSGAVDSVLAVPVPTIERIGGGSVRCMLAEVPQNQATVIAAKP